jgi:hypothetical protein
VAALVFPKDAVSASAEFCEMAEKNFFYIACRCLYSGDVLVSSCEETR